MGNSVVALVFVLVLNVLMWLSQVSIVELNPTGTQFYNCEGSIMEGFGSDCTNESNMVLNTDVASQLPSAQNVETTTNPFTDIFNNILGWIKGLPGINYLVNMVSAPYNLMKAIGLPNQLAFGLGFLWYGITLFCVVAFLWGRE